MKYWWWKIRYAYWAMRWTYCSPKSAWYMATVDDLGFKEGSTPKDAVYDELSSWDAD